MTADGLADQTLDQGRRKAKATVAKDWTVRELAKDYWAKRLVSLAESTQVGYGRHLKRIENRLESKRLVEVHERFSTIMDKQRFQVVYPVLPIEILGIYILLPE